MGQGLARVTTILRDLRPTGQYYEPQEFKPVKVSKPDREHCKQAVQKLAFKPYAPTKDEDIELAGKQVIGTLMEVCLDNRHVDRTVDKILRELPRWPDITDIRDIAWEMRDMELRPDPKCPHCGGNGFRVFRKTVRTAIFGDQVVEQAGKCDCYEYVRIAS
jgi:hypothetical protein